MAVNVISENVDVKKNPDSIGTKHPQLFEQEKGFPQIRGSCSGSAPCHLCSRSRGPRTVHSPPEGSTLCYFLLECPKRDAYLNFTEPMTYDLCPNQAPNNMLSFRSRLSQRGFSIPQQPLFHPMLRDCHCGSHKLPDRNHYECTQNKFIKWLDT